MRRLIVNADDFGFTVGVNRAIAEAHTHGIVTSSTLMANGLAFDDAVSRAAQLPRLSIGCHVLLTDGAPVLPANRLSTLVEPGIERGSATGRFRDGMAKFALRALLGHMNAEEIEVETMAQIRKIQTHGIAVSHVDSHKHTHLFPAILRPILRAALACGVRAVRNPFGPRRPLKSADLVRRPSLWTRAAEVRALRALASQFHHAAKQMQMATTDGTIGIEVTGALDYKLFAAIAQSIPEGTWEFVCHPGYNDADLQRAHTRLRESRELELAVLTMPEARAILSKHGAELISYRDLI